MSLRKTTVINFAGKEVTAKELTVAEIAGVMDEMKTYQPHVLDLLMQQDLPVQVVQISTGLGEEELMAAAPTALDPLYDAVVAVNPSLAALTERLKKTVERLPATPSEKLPASS
jgi:ubiquinone biosynthesis protein UbiJ